MERQRNLSQVDPIDVRIKKSFKLSLSISLGIIFALKLFREEIAGQTLSYKVDGFVKSQNSELLIKNGG